MLRGTVRLRAQIKGDGIQFDACEFGTNVHGVEKIILESQDGDEILATVSFAHVATDEDGKSVATNVTSVALDRLSFMYNIGIDETEIIDNRFSERSPPGASGLMAGTGATVFCGRPITTILGVTADEIRAGLERRDAPGQEFYSLFRSAKLSHGPVEEFLQMYNLLLMLFEDNQSKVDAFLLSEDSTIPQTPDPRPHVDRMETVYTRLRNEFGHHRSGITLSETRKQMAERVGELIPFVQKAIERVGESKN